MLSAKFDEYKILIDEYINNYFNMRKSDNKSINAFIDAVLYSYNSGGKRIRPGIMLMISDLIEIEIRDIMPFAAALEMIHTYSLIHDDLPSMDDDDMRRGKPTLHIKYNEGVAVLAGDYLLNEASEIILDDIVSSANTMNKLKAFKYLYNSSGLEGMLGGQVIDIEDNDSMSKSEVLRMYEQKTAQLFKVSCVIPGYLKGLENYKIDKLEELGKSIGMTFQLIDDLLDREEDEEIGKTTVLSILGLDETKQLIDDYHRKSKALLVDFGFENSVLSELINSLVLRSI
ncbi:MAG: polyprenyl synthetase family protein [Tissierellia bacterium]|nr:polyprenyl synthetase family protein [Tissierellia bacterium]